MVAGKSAQHLQSECVEPGQALVASVGKMIDMLQLQMVWLNMLGTWGLQEEMAEMVAQGNSNVGDLHMEM